MQLHRAKIDDAQCYHLRNREGIELLADRMSGCAELYFLL